MVNNRTAMRNLALIGLLTGALALHAQTPIGGDRGLAPREAPTPTISSLQSSQVGSSGPSNGAAITANTAGQEYGESGNGFFLYVNGNFNVSNGSNETVVWTVAGNPNELLTVSESNSQVVAFVAQYLYGSPEIATITVQESSESEFNGIPSISNSLTFTVNPALASIGQLPSAVVGTAYSQAFFTGGTGPFTLTNITGLPPGLTFTGTGNPLTGNGNPLSGTPTAMGTYYPFAAITDSWGNQLSVDDAIQINTIPQINIITLPNGVINTAYPNTTFTASNGSGSYTFSAMGLPTGLTLNAGGLLSGTPTVSGPFNPLVEVTDTNGNSSERSFPFTIYAILTVASSSLPSGRLNTPYSTTLAASGGAPVYNWSATGLPAGLSLSSAGLLSGTPTASGAFTVNITLTDGSSQTARASLPLSIVPTLIITTTGLPSGTVGSGYLASLSGSGGVPPYSWGASGLPAGLSINSTSGVISGNPTQSGSASVTVTLSDNSGLTARATFGISINPAPLPPVQVSTSSLPN